MNNPECPTCGKEFPTEDFCPVHGILLIVPKIAVDSELGIDEASVSTQNIESIVSDSDSEEIIAGSKHESSTKLASFMSRLGLRRSKVNSDDSHEINLPASLLPEEVLDGGWKIAGSLLSASGVDAWPVEREISNVVEQGVYRRFRTGSLTHPAIYDRILPVSLSPLPNLVAHGTVDMSGARTDFELVSNIQPGMMLDRWFAESNPSEERAQFLLRSLSTVLTELSNGGFQPIVLEASQLSVSEDGKIALISLGVIAEIQTSADFIKYRPEFLRSALLPQDCTAPEVLQQSVLSENAAVFSVGQLLSQAIWGQCFTHKDIQIGEVPFHTIIDERLATILRGCLWPKSIGRWTQSELNTAIFCDVSLLPTVNAWASLAPGASSTVFGFAGESYWRLEDLLLSAVQPQNWSEAVVQISNILKWSGDTSWAGQAKMIVEAMDSGRSNDFALIKLSRVVNPSTQPNWRELDLSKAEAQKSLAALAHRALKGSSDANLTVEALFECDLRGSFTQVQFDEHQTSKQELKGEQSVH
jgi:hypothetical protein